MLLLDETESCVVTSLEKAYNETVDKFVHLLEILFL